MPSRLLIATAAALLATASSAYASTLFNGSYTAVDSVSGPYAPTINYDGGPYLSSPFTQSLAQGVTTTPTTFIQVAPVSGGSNVGTQTGSVNIAMTLTGPSASKATSVTYSSGGDNAFISNGVLYFAANYELFYGNQTDCITWDSTTCTPTGNTTTIGETLTVDFADNAVMAINLYNWSDWDMAPDISFDMVNAPQAVPEPASFALFGSALIGLWAIARRRTGKSSVRQA